MQQQPITLAVLFGGKSQEHPISLISARDVIAQLDKTRYQIMPIGIDYDGSWWWQQDINCLNAITEPKNIPLHENARPIALIPGKNTQCITLDATPTIQHIDMAFPVLHGPYGEDGTVQAMLEGANIPYVGANISSSAVCMDKYLSKCVLRNANLPCADFCTLRRYEYDVDHNTLTAIIHQLDLPLFVKPVNLGSSIAIHKVYNATQLKIAVEDAFQYADHILFEPDIRGRELECAVMGNQTLQTTLPAELHTTHDFYSYEAKYLDKAGTHFSVPADLTDDLQKRIRDLALQAYQAAGCSGLARVDFFIAEDDQILINEINTMPGFTPISLFPRMWANSGLTFAYLLDKLIALAFEKNKAKQALKVHYTRCT